MEQFISVTVHTGDQFEPRIHARAWAGETVTPLAHILSLGRWATVWLDCREDVAKLRDVLTEHLSITLPDQELIDAAAREATS